MALAETIINNRDIRDYEFSKFLLTKDVALLTWQNTLDTLSQTDIREHVEGLGRRLFRGVPDRQEDFGVESEGRVLNEALQRLGGRNVV